MALQELQRAAEHGDVESEYLLGLVYANGLGTPVSDGEARRWLSAAAEKSYPNAAAALDSLQLPASRDASGDPRFARELLIWAIRHDPAHLMERVKAAGVDSADEFGRSPLDYAITSGSLSAVRQLMDAGASLEHADRFGATPLMLAAEGESDSVLEAILQASKNVDVKDSVGNTAMIYAMRAARQQHVSLLLAAGAASIPVAPIVKEQSGVDPTRPGALYQGWPPLAIAVIRDDRDVVQKLMIAGARVDEPTPQGATPLVVAAQYDAVNVLALLLKGGATPTRDRTGRRAIGFAASAGNDRIIDVLLAAGSPIESPSPLFAAVEAGRSTL